MLGSLILYLKDMRTTMFQLSGFYCTSTLKGCARISGALRFEEGVWGSFFFWGGGLGFRGLGV